VAARDDRPKLYGVFENDFIRKPRYFDKLKVIWDNRKLDGRYDEGFWHLITKDDQVTRERLPDFPRASRLSWCGPCISNYQDVIVRVWDFVEGNGKIRTYLWLENWDYVVVLEKKPKTKEAFLVTAYYVEGDSTRRRLKKKLNDKL